MYITTKYEGQTFGQKTSPCYIHGLAANICMKANNRTLQITNTEKQKPYLINHGKSFLVIFFFWDRVCLLRIEMF